MIFLDTEVVEYTSLRVQEGKTPDLIKTLRGNGTLENSSEYGVEERLHLNFTVNEKELIKFFKIYSRFQTLCLLPVYSSNIKHKIYDAFLQYKKSTLNAMFESLEGNTEIVEKLKEKIDQVIGFNKEPIKLDILKELKLDIDPNVNDCMMMFLESFSVRSIQDSSDGFEVEMILWVCNDLTFYNSDEQNFLTNYYKEFFKKMENFNSIDKIIEDYFNINSSNMSTDLVIDFKSIENIKEVYNEKKIVEKSAIPKSIYIDTSFITQLEIRAMNNLQRLPIVGKTKGFIQHLGKGEIGVTFKLILNQKNALEKELIKNLKAISLFEQDTLISVSSDFYLLKCFDIKELSLSTHIIEEPSDDVDVTMITLFFVGACTSKLEESQNYFNKEITRGSSIITLKLFNRFLDKVLMPIDIFDRDLEYSEDKYRENLKPFLDMVISKSDYEQSLDSVELGEGIKKNVQDKNYTLQTLFKSYEQTEFNSIKEILKKKMFDFSPSEETDTGSGLFDAITENAKKYPKDSFYLDKVLLRFQRLAFLLLITYKGNKEEKEFALMKILDNDNKTQADFLLKVYTPFLADYIYGLTLSDSKLLIRNSIEMVFRIELMNNAVMIMKEFLEMEEFKKVNNQPLIDKNSFKLDSDISLFLKNACIKAYNIMLDITSTDTFSLKVKDFLKMNYYKNTEIKEFEKTYHKAIDVEIDIFRKKAPDYTSDIFMNIQELTELIFKLNIMACRTGDKKRDLLFSMDLEPKVYLLTSCLMSIFFAPMNSSPLIYGYLAYASAINFVGPFSISLTALEDTKNDLVLYQKSLKDDNDKIVATSKNFQKINKLLNVLKFTFGNENISLLRSLNKTYIRENFLKKDFQYSHGVMVFSEFESPMDFLKSISEKTKRYEELIKNSNSDINSLEKFSNGIDLDKMLKDLNETGDKEIDNAIDRVITTFAPAKILSDLTINKYQPNSVVSSNIMQSELLGEFKYLRAFKNATRLLTYQYERMMPDYEVFILDEIEIRKSLKRGYNLQDKMYSISNIISININKDEVSNLKYAVIKIRNTTPHFMGLDTVIKNFNALTIDNGDEAIYDKKFVTKKLIFKQGQVVNISLDQSSDYYDFTGKIDSVTIDRDIITLHCVNFSAELMNEIFSVKNVTSSGFVKGSISSFLNAFRKFKKTGKISANSKQLIYTNDHIIPTYLVDSIFENYYDIFMAGASCVLYTGIDKTLSSLKHLDCPYNNLIQGIDLTTNLKRQSSLTSNVFDDGLSDGDTFTAHRISENINSVELDLSFYGLQQIQNGDSVLTTSNNSARITKIKDILNGPPKSLVPGHSSFIKKIIVKDTVGKDSPLFNNDHYYYETKKGGYLESEIILKTTDEEKWGYGYEYNRKNIKLYDVLNDLTLRNPGTFWEVYESGQYGTLFFGRNNYLVSRKNKNSSLSKKDIEKISIVALELADDYTFEDLKIPKPVLANILMDLSELSSVFDSSLNKNEESNKKIQNKLKILNFKGKSIFDDIKMHQPAYEGVEPVSDIILAVSGFNLLSCTIKTNENYYNSVKVEYKPTLSDLADRLTDFFYGANDEVLLKSFEGLPNERLRTLYIDPFKTKDIHTETQAFEYAQSVFMNELKNFYDGKIVLLYQPNIKINDEVLIIDSKNKINGTVIVKGYQHIIDSEVGAITIITPGMKVKTSSLMTDVYMTGLVSKIKYEYLKTNSSRYNVENIEKINQEASVELNRLLNLTTKNFISVPIAFDNIGYNLEIKDVKKKKQVSKNSKKEEYTKEIKYEQSREILTPRNISSLPIKIYPLIRNGQLLIPDEDIYNSVDRPFSFIVRLIATLGHMITSTLDFDTNFKKLMGVFKDFGDLFDLNNSSIYKEIVKMFVPALAGYYEESDKQFIERLLSDNYYNLPFSSNVFINRDLINKQTAVFFNCKQLNQYEEERIDQIAKVLSQFSIVNLVELNGKITEDNTPDGKVTGFDFNVVEKLRQRMEYYSQNLVKKENEKSKFWTTAITERLIDGPVGDYDDFGAVLINCDKNSANYIISNPSKVKLSSSIFDNTLKSTTRYAISYDMRVKLRLIETDGYIEKPTMPFINIRNFVFHNFYGEDNFGDNTSANYELRRELLKQLLHKARIYSNYTIFGDFNLELRDSRMRVMQENANTEAFNLFIGVQSFGDRVCIRESKTTTGGKRYDNIVLNRSLHNRHTSTSNIFNYSNTHDLSDHLPIYLVYSDLMVIY